MATLALSPEQESKLVHVKELLGVKMHAIEADASLTPQQKEERMSALKQEHERLFSSILTPQQLDEAKKIQSLKSDSDIPAVTEQQEQQIRELKTGFAETARQIDEDASLSPQEKKARMEGIHNSIMERMHQILTPEQLSQMHQQKSVQEAGPYSLAAIATLDNVTPAQKQRLESIHREAQRRLQATLTPAQRQRLLQIQQGR